LLVGPVVKSSSLRMALVALGCLLVSGCSSTVVGTGGDSSSGRIPTTGNEGPSGDTATEIPEEIAALFAAPDSTSVTPNSIFGVWANDASSGYETRFALTKTEMTVAKRCSSDGRIAYVTSKVRATESNITVLESNSTQLTPTSSYSSCSFTLELEVAEWRGCDDTGYDYNCFKVQGTTLTGIDASSFSTPLMTWVKLWD
jgi:predicted small secreted protein